MSNPNSEIFKAFARLHSSNPKWLKAIECRLSGSQWRSGDRSYIFGWERIAALPWQKIPDTERVPELYRLECNYYRCTQGLHPTATENIKLLSEFKNFNSICIVEGAHGLELRSHDVQERPTSEAWLITGPDSSSPSETIVYTAYPGKYALNVTKHPLWDCSFDCLEAIARTDIPIAVKGW